jgi:hypothetical protein
LGSIDSEKIVVEFRVTKPEENARVRKMTRKTFIARTWASYRRPYHHERAVQIHPLMNLSGSLSTSKTVSAERPPISPDEPLHHILKRLPSVSILIGL